ncbi:MAG: ATP-binding protein [Acidobacteriota bacterium]|nr:ATP-binding protein [Acidobacteriota bacterium]
MLKILTIDDYRIDDLFHFERVMCSVCGLIFDYKFEPELPGWPDFDPPLSILYPWRDEEGNERYDEPEREELCPRCAAKFKEHPPKTVIVREVMRLSDFFRPGESESETLELKQVLVPDKVQKTMAAFATTQGGKIIIGVANDGTGYGYSGPEDISTTSGKDKIQERIRGIAAGIEPNVRVKIHFVQNEEGKHFVVILIPKGLSPLYSINGKHYLRDNDQTRPIRPDELLEITGKFHDRQRVKRI